MISWANPTQPPNCISIGLAVCAGLTNVINRQTDTHSPTDHDTASVAIWLRCGLIITSGQRILNFFDDRHHCKGRIFHWRQSNATLSACSCIASVRCYLPKAMHRLGRIMKILATGQKNGVHAFGYNFAESSATCISLLER